MKVLRPIQALIWTLSVLATAAACAHGGGQDGNGGHVNTATGEYHCHQPGCVLPTGIGEPDNEISVASFNIQWVGNSPHRDNVALAAMLSRFDVVVVQEVVSPPFAGFFPSGNPFKPDQQSTDFFDAMEAQGFDFILSPEDTGTNDNINVNGSATEWWVTFYDPNKVQPDADLPNGFIADDRSNHDDYERVPYAFGFSSESGEFDFVFVSVHLKPGDRTVDATRRAHENESIIEWVGDNDDDEQDIIILGDMNFKNCNELAVVMPTGYASLNDACLPTNTNVNGPRPYDHVLYKSADTTAAEMPRSLEVINLIDVMEVSWHMSNTTPYPGDPYNHNAFRAAYSDHHPIAFRLIAGDTDDD